jgi:SecD/SecF fusion protein
MRSVNTSLVVLLPILSLMLFGGQTLKDFAFAMFVGVAIGAYSSIFIAAPVLAIFKEHEKRYQQIEARRSVRESAGGKPSAAALAAVAEVEAETPTTPAGTSDAAAVRATARQGASARPRPKNKRKPPAKRKRR